jgi:hypothetical protein
MPLGMLTREWCFIFGWIEGRQALWGFHWISWDFVEIVAL